MFLNYQGLWPQVADSAFVDESARVIGDVAIGAEASIWFNVVARGDVNFIRIGCRTNIQDGSVVHVTNDTHPTILGDSVTVGHNATLHGCTVEDRCLIGMGAIVLDGVVVGEESMVAAGSLLVPGTVVEPRSLVMGAPAKVRRRLDAAEIRDLQQSADNYVLYKEVYLRQGSGGGQS